MTTLTPTHPAGIAALARDRDLLADRLMAGARGDIGTQAAISLLIAHDYWLSRTDWLTEAAWAGADGCSDLPFVWVDWPTAADFARRDDRCSRSSRAVLQVAAGLAGGPAGPGLRDLLAALSHEAWPLVSQACATVAELTRPGPPALVWCEGCEAAIPAGAAETHVHPAPPDRVVVLAADAETGVAA